MRLPLVLAVAAVLALPAAALACPREQTVTVKVDCERGIIRLEGRNFARDRFPIDLDGPGEYELHLRAHTRNWRERVPLGGDGTYTLMWGGPGPGFWQFSVDCEPVAL